MTIYDDAESTGLLSRLATMYMNTQADHPERNAELVFGPVGADYVYNNDRGTIVYQRYRDSFDADDLAHMARMLEPPEKAPGTDDDADAR